MRFYYRDLWIPQTATAEQIKSAYRKLARELHPDHSAQSGHSDPAQFLAVGEAYQVLSDATLRAKYDAELCTYLKRRGWVLCPRCGAHNDIPAIPESKVAMCGRCHAHLPVTEKERRSGQVEVLREQAIDVVAELGADLLAVTGDFLHGKLQGLRSRLGVKSRKGAG
jgi:curved DNA-binding protein CbpA